MVILGHLRSASCCFRLCYRTSLKTKQKKQACDNMVSCQSTFGHWFEIWIANDPPEHTSVKSVVLHLRWAEPNGISFFAEPMTREDDGFLRITLVPVPDESQLGVLGNAVVSADVAVEESTFHPQRFSGQHAVRLQVHRPVYTSIHCGREKSPRLTFIKIINSKFP